MRSPGTSDQSKNQPSFCDRSTGLLVIAKLLVLLLEPSRLSVCCTIVAPRTLLIGTPLSLSRYKLWIAVLDVSGISSRRPVPYSTTRTPCTLVLVTPPVVVVVGTPHMVTSGRVVIGLSTPASPILITDTGAAPKQLWEFCADPAVCALNDPDLGLTFGNPQFGTLADGRWVVFVTSGYNNITGTDGVAGGDGKGYLYILDAYTGQLLKKVGTNSGDPVTPSGLAKITAISDDPSADPKATYIYGGDNQGQMWRFDLTAASGAVSVIKMGDAGVDKPITTRPDVTMLSLIHI